MRCSTAMSCCACTAFRVPCMTGCTAIGIVAPRSCWVVSRAISAATTWVSLLPGDAVICKPYTGTWSLSTANPGICPLHTASNFLSTPCMAPMSSRCLALTTAGTFIAPMTSATVAGSPQMRKCSATEPPLSVAAPKPFCCSPIWACGLNTRQNY